MDPRHDDINLARLIRRLDKAVNGQDWDGSSPNDLWLRSLKTLQNVKFAKRLWKNIELSGTSAYALLPLSLVLEYTSKLFTARILNVTRRSEYYIGDSPYLLKVLTVSQRSKPKNFKPSSVLSNIPKAVVDTPEAELSLETPEEPSKIVETPSTDNLLTSPANLPSASITSPNPTLISPLFSNASTSTAIASGAFLENSKARHEAMSEQLAQMAVQLRKNAQNFSEKLAEDKAIVEETQTKLDSNFGMMQKERVRLRDHSGKSGSTTCLVILAVVAVIVTFVFMVALIRLTRRPATLAEATPRQSYLASSEDNYSFTDGSRTPTKAPPTPSHMYNDSTTVYSRAAGDSFGFALARSGWGTLILAFVGYWIGSRNILVAKELWFQRTREEYNQFCISTVPTSAFFVERTWFYRTLDWHVRWYQPYVIMSRGNAKPQESVLLDYITLGSVFSIINSAKFKHRVITWSSVTALATYILQPLAGSMFQLQNLNTPTNTNVNSTRAIGLSDFSDLTAFVSSAGFAEAAVFNRLPDPPFIQNSWTVAQFEFPNKLYLNGTMTVNTTAIQTTTNCLGPDGTPSLTATNGGFIINSTSVDGCTQTVELFNTDLSSQQYGVVADSCSTVNTTQSPVMFWFFHHAADGSPEARTVFCKPTLQAFNVEVMVNLNNDSVINVEELNSNVPSNNVTGPYSNSPFNGFVVLRPLRVLSEIAFISVIFENQTDPFIQARATATTNGVPGAIFRFAAQSPGGANAVFSAANPFLDITNTVYTLYLAVVAQSIYFVPHDSALDAQLSSISLRLTINPLPGHALALFLFFIGFVGVFLHIISRRQRRGLYLSTPPGTIAATIAMSAHSGFGELLMPFDDEKTLERKLSDLRFSIDDRTGAIVANPASISTDSKRMSKKADQEEALQSLLGSEYKRPPSEMGVGTDLYASSSQAAYEAASGYPPTRSPRSFH
ncbi:hypothetical protein DFJ43DRAFT_1044297 [Lentinula guzmanii]|uniref:Uncharacterized protein n=1 Tax=Lentinula guzmanii TaxID=2804957 RepID=A0AA38MUQ4_9AGAR|nr:hypothetical protein DFJ43DRAFT_1044297 [Lentinula guzmanii]